MATITIDHIGKVVSFNLYPASILGTNYNLSKVLAILDADTAMAYVDVSQLHTSVYGTIPDPNKPVDDYRSYSYLKLQLSNGQTGIIGIPWIDGELTIHQNNTIRADISNVGASDVAKIRTMLIANGYNDAVLLLV